MVYVDDSRWRWRGQQWCHLMAETEPELHAFARRLGLRPEWFQDKPGHPHYDLIARRRAEAIACGAIPVTTHEMLRRCGRRRASPQGG